MHYLQIFNYRLSRVRRLIENAFGILSATWRLLLRRIDLEPEKVKDIVTTCAILHNIIRRDRPVPVGTIPHVPHQDDYELGMNGIQAAALRPSEEAKFVRENFCGYFNNEGAVEWQQRMI